MNQANKKNMPDRTWPGMTTSALSVDNLQNGSDKTATGIKQQSKLIKINNITTICIYIYIYILGLQKHQ